MSKEPPVTSHIVITASSAGQPLHNTGFTPIEEYAVIGDCRTAALVSRRGSIDWLCFPHFSGPAVFAALLDPVQGGRFAINPNGEYQVQRRYIDKTNVLETIFKTKGGMLRLTDCLTVPDVAQEHRCLQPQREVLRIVEVLTGEVDLEVVYAPRPDFGRNKGRLRKYNRLGWACPHRDELFMLYADMTLDIDSKGNSLYGCAHLTAGQKRRFSLTYTKRDIGTIAPLGRDAEARLSGTVQWWRTWSEQLTYEGPYREMVLRSALTLKLMTYSLSGAVVAAPTASLPEKIGGAQLGLSLLLAEGCGFNSICV